MGSVPIGIGDVEIATEYTAKDDVLVKVETPSKIVPVQTRWNLAEIRAEIARIDGAIQAWQDKRAPLQEILDKYNATVAGGK